MPLDLVPGTVLAGRFRIESMLGVGGMGVVYRATDDTLGVPVALKLLRPELARRTDAIERFRDELLMARQVSSPHVVRIHDIVRHDDQWLISMDLIDGESLGRRLDRECRLPVHEALRITRQVAEGLGAAHARGVVHRDLKPANILLDASGDAYITDFGVARSLSSSGLTRSGAVVGTPDYLSPEQARGEAVDGRSDLYALGLILYEMLAGQQAFAGGTVTEVLAQRMVRTPAPVTALQPDVPTWVARLVDRLLRPRAAHRFADAAAVVQAIDRKEVPRDVAPPRRAVWAVALLLLFASLAVAGWWWSQRTPVSVAPVAPTTLDRLMVLPVTTPDGRIDDPRLAALGAHLRQAITAGAGGAVVDDERTWQVLRQLEPTGRATADIDALHVVGVAERILQPVLQQRDGRVRIHSTLYRHNGGATTITGPFADDAVAALQAWAEHATSGLPVVGQTGLDLALPESPAALDALGQGLIAQRAGALGDALGHLRDATSLAPDYALAWLSLVDTALAIGEHDVAETAIDKAVASATTGTGLAPRIQARQALLEGDPTRAVASWRALAERQPDDTSLALELARAQGAGGDFTGALATLRQLVQRDDNDPRVWFELGKFSILSGDARRAVDDHLVRALVLYKRSRNGFGEAETVNALGVGYGRLGQTADAIEQYRKAVELRGLVGNRRGVATSLRNLANLYALTGDFEQAAGHLARARTLHEELGDRAGLAAVENELGLLLEERGDYLAALQAFQRSLRAWRDAVDPHGVAQALNDIGFANYQLGDYNDAQVYWRQAATAHADLGNRTGLIRTTQNLGLLDTARGEWDRARQRLLTSLAEAEQQQMVEEAAVSHRNLAELELLQGHLDAALEQADAAASMFEHRDDQRGRVDAVLLTVQALIAAGAPAEAAARLAEIQPSLQEASLEQQAIARLVRARLPPAAGSPVATAELEHAARLAAASGVRALQLQIALQRARITGTLPADLDAGTESLGHATLRLAWLELAMRQALQRGDPGAAVTAYREAARLLRNGDHLDAGALHRLGAAAHAASGDTAGEEAALRLARDADATRRRRLPTRLRDERSAAANASQRSAR
ncbi:hypothetical protein N799_05975 [Lysobacter arseniciresistens ZS79]|uniref:non-specific serine/threonine protein kinase n=1 Tax=Lysobacter arseniciresistens ZS79 TaxID=913325 RepID=A0A0A0F887_9GAMM|nr:hypothetical protein N799_05975 [Lysobacter arseniciresistens ZS79]